MVKCPKCGSDMVKMYPDLEPKVENYEMLRMFRCTNNECRLIKQLQPSEILMAYLKKKGLKGLNEVKKEIRRNIK